MNPEWWSQVSRVLDQLFQLDESEWQNHLDELGQREPRLAAEIKGLLAQDSKKIELEKPPDHLMNVLRSATDERSHDQLLERAAGPRKTINLNATATPPLLGDQTVCQHQRDDLPEQAGRFLVLREIARGGMGVVVEAFDPNIERELALKIILPAVRDNVNAEARFLREARITGQLQHPGIPPIHEIGQLDDGRQFFAMKLIQGETLAQWLSFRQGTMDDLSEMVDIFEQICQAVAYAHSRGIIHRDLKPQNIMVGSFGQVQVMDWGLAKTIQTNPAWDVVVDADPADLSPDNRDELTRQGDRMGTPAYMAPEQASGKNKPLDERCDVFGLGGILCVMLTGAPPCPNSSLANRRHRGPGDELSLAYEKLDQCGAESELIELAKKCLARETSDRFDDAGQVVDAITGFRQRFRQRLRAAELDRETSQIQLMEERKRLRVTRAFAFSIVALVITLVAVAVAAQQYYANRQFRADGLNENVGSILDRVEQDRGKLLKQLADSRQVWPMLSDPRDWDIRLKRLDDMARQASELAASDEELMTPNAIKRMERLVATLRSDRQDFQLVQKLQNIHLVSATPVGGLFDPSQEGPLYVAALSEAGFDIGYQSPESIAERFRQSPIRYALVAAIDCWANAVAEPDQLRKLLEIARRADDDPLRNRFRTIEVWENRNRLEALASKVEPEHESPNFLDSLAARLDRTGGDAGRLLQQALLYYPDDFSLHFSLGNTYRDPRDAESEFRAALAIRPDSSVVFTNLGSALFRQHKREAARQYYVRALEIDPDFAPAQHNLGVLLEQYDDFENSVKHFRNVLAVAPDNASSHFHLGFGLMHLGQTTDAIRHYQLAVQSDPSHAQAHTNLAFANMDNGDVAAAIDHFQSAIASNPELFEPHLGLASAYFRLRKYDLAIDHYQAAVDLNPGNATAQNNLGFALLSHGDALAAIDHLQAAIRISPDHASAHFNLGNALGEIGKRNDAIAHLRTATELKPDYAEAWCNLGHELRKAKKYSEALEALKRGHQLGSKRDHWRYPSARWVEDCQQLLEQQK